MEHWAGIIEQAAKSPAGTIALVILVIGFIALTFFRADSSQIRLGVFAVLVVGAGLAVYAVISIAPISGPVVVQDSIQPAISQPAASGEEARPPKVTSSTISPEEAAFQEAAKEFLKSSGGQ